MIARLWVLLHDPAVLLALFCGGIAITFGLIDAYLVGRDDDDGGGSGW